MKNIPCGCLKTVLELQYVLDKLGDDDVRTDLKQGLSGVPILSEEELSLLDEFYKLVDPERDMSLRYDGVWEQNLKKYCSLAVGR